MAPAPQQKGNLHTAQLLEANSLGRERVQAEDVARDDHALDLARALINLVDLGVAEELLDATMIHTCKNYL